MKFHFLSSFIFLLTHCSSISVLNRVPRLVSTTGGQKVKKCLCVFVWVRVSKRTRLHHSVIERQVDGKLSNPKY